MPYYICTGEKFSCVFIWDVLKKSGKVGFFLSQNNVTSFCQYGEDKLLIVEAHSPNISLRACKDCKFKPCLYSSAYSNCPRRKV